MSSELAPHIILPEPKLSFHPDRRSDVDIHPLRGLLRFGPYSGGLLPGPIRVATIAPAGESAKLYEFMRQLSVPHEPRERKDYLPKWPGFFNVFGVHVTAADSSCRLEIEREFEREFEAAKAPHVILADRLVRAIQSLKAVSHQFDVLFIYIPQRWQPGFSGEDDDFDLHDHLKAFTAGHHLPIQMVREDKAISYTDKASVMWRIGLALYAKAGGVPWKLADMHEEVAHIGISYAVRAPGTALPRFVTCCSQVFDNEGSGLEFVAYDANDVEVQGDDNPFLSRTEMFRVMTRSLDLYQRRHAGRSPKRIIVHKSTEFKAEEVAGCMEAFHLCESVDLVQVVADVNWRGVLIGSPRTQDSGKGQATPYPVPRGTAMNLGAKEALLWLHGDVQGIKDRGGSYFQGGKGTPRPLKLVRHAGHGAWDETAGAALALSKMNWNNDALYDPLPVTMGYAQILARVVKRMTGLGNTPYQFRFFM